jgi:hypothetical protein
MKLLKNTTKTVNQVIDELIDTAISNSMKNLPVKIEGIINSAFISILGLDYGGKQVDHCNGRWNMFQNIIENEAKKDLLEIIKNIKLKFNFDEFKDAFQKEYINQFNYQIKYCAKDQAEKLAKSIIESRINELIPKKLEIPKKG